MPIVTIKVNGLSRVQKKLSQLPSAVEKEVISKAIEDGLGVILRRIKATAPVKTGKVRRGFKIYPSKIDKESPRIGAQIWLSGARLGRDNPNHVFYARWQEYGFRAGIRSRIITNEKGQKVKVYNKNHRVEIVPRSDRPGKYRKRRVGWKKVPAKFFVHRAFNETAESAIFVFRLSAERGTRRVIEALERD